MKKTKTVREIVAEYLKKNKFIGLCCDDCGCGIDELMCCLGDCDECVPATSKKWDKEAGCYDFYQ